MTEPAVLQKDEKIRLVSVSKSFTNHESNLKRSVLQDVSLSVRSGECVALDGPSGIGKSTLLRMIYGTYHVPDGQIWIRQGDNAIDITKTDPWTLINLRKHTVGYVSQFLHVLPRVATIDIVAASLSDRNVDSGDAQEKAAEVLERLAVPSTLWTLSPLSFSGGEQQRVNLARGLAGEYPLLLLDEPTASLDPDNKERVFKLIEQSLADGTAIVGIFHDSDVSRRLTLRSVDLHSFQPSTRSRS